MVVDRGFQTGCLDKCVQDESVIRIFIKKQVAGFSLHRKTFGPRAGMGLKLFVFEQFPKLSARGFPDLRFLQPLFELGTNPRHEILRGRQ